MGAPPSILGSKLRLSVSSEVKRCGEHRFATGPLGPASVATARRRPQTSPMPTNKVWSGSISFGLVNVPVGLYAATEDKSVRFHRYHVEDGGRIRQKRVCEIDGEELDTADIARGYELPGGDMVVMTDADFEGLPVPTLKAITVEAFVPQEQIDPIMYAGSYYLVPDKAGARAYALLRDAIEKAGMTAIVKIAIRERERLAAIRVREEVLVLETMLWPDEVREAVEVPESSAGADELAAAQALIDQMTVDFDPEQYTDHYREALLAAIDAKAEGREVITPPAPPEEAGGKVLDLMAALKASVEQAKMTREEPKKRAAAHPKSKKKTAKSATRRSA
ncbi:Ku protein [Catenulispora subtropica]|uniref:Non-homologous end joining protein Ku n=2 Tax=Catenulispora subtropica TaxID=450798 RepID=A0ABN2SGA8_9ACTN